MNALALPRLRRRPPQQVELAVDGGEPLVARLQRIEQELQALHRRESERHLVFAGLARSVEELELELVKIRVALGGDLREHARHALITEVRGSVERMTDAAGAIRVGLRKVAASLPAPPTPEPKNLRRFWKFDR